MRAGDCAWCCARAVLRCFAKLAVFVHEWGRTLSVLWAVRIDVLVPVRRVRQAAAEFGVGLKDLSSRASFFIEQYLGDLACRAAVK